MIRSSLLHSKLFQAAAAAAGGKDSRIDAGGMSPMDIRSSSHLIRGGVPNDLTLRQIMNPLGTFKIKSSAFNVIQAVVEEDDEESGRQDPTRSNSDVPHPSNEELKIVPEEEEPQDNVDETEERGLPGLTSVEASFGSCIGIDAIRGLQKN